MQNRIFPAKLGITLNFGNPDECFYRISCVSFVQAPCLSLYERHFRQFPTISRKIYFLLSEYIYCSIFTYFAKNHQQCYLYRLVFVINKHVLPLFFRIIWFFILQILKYNQNIFIKHLFFHEKHCILLLQVIPACIYVFKGIPLVFLLSSWTQIYGQRKTMYEQKKRS